MQHRGHPELCLEPGFAESQQRGARGVKEQLIEFPLILTDQRVERMRQSKDHVEVTHW